jgi:DNA polymerase III sliding clamp (beta) subunit (PCNA family)
LTDNNNIDILKKYSSFIQRLKVMNFKKAFLLASKYVSSRPSHPVLACLAIKDNTMIAYDLNTAIAIPLDNPIADICVPTSVIAKLLKKSKGDLNITVKIDKRDRLSLEVQEGSSRHSVDALPIEAYPELPDVESNNSIRVKESTLAKVFKELKPTVCKDGTKRILTGINIRIANGKAIATATNGHAATQNSFDVTGGEGWNITIPVKFFEVLDVKSDREVQIYHDSRNICMEIGHIKIFQRLIEGNYPNIPDLMRQSFAALSHHLKRGLLDNLAIAKAFGVNYVDLHIVHDTKTRCDSELIVAMETTDSLTHTFTLPTHTPAWLAFSAQIIGEFNRITKGIRFTHSYDKGARSLKGLVADLKYEFVTGSMDYRLPIQASESQSAKVNIKLLEAQLKAMPKNREVMISLRNESTFAPNAIVLSSLGTSLVSVIMPVPNSAPKPLVAVLSDEDVAAIAKLDELIELGNNYTKEAAIAKIEVKKPKKAKTKAVTKSESTEVCVSIRAGDRYRNNRRDNKYHRFAV